MLHSLCNFCLTSIPTDRYKVGLNCQFTVDVIMFIEFQAEASHKSSDEKVRTVDATEVEGAATVKKPTSTADDDYKAKLAENRRLAREKAERESAEEKARAEERRCVKF